jgi:hypothetical protein
VADLRRDLRLAAKARVAFGVLQRAEQHLDGEPLGQPLVLGGPHRAHPALPDELGDLVGLAQNRPDVDLGPSHGL